MRVLVIEDSAALRTSLQRGLTSAGHTVVSAATGREGLEQVSRSVVDVVVLDVMLPDTDGFSVLSRVRELPDGPAVIMLTALSSVEERVRGLSGGADDYLGKPFAFAELVARITSVSRRRVGLDSSAVLAGNLRIDLRSLRATVHGTDIGLSPREFAVLEFLGKNIGSVVTRSQIERYAYAPDERPTSNAIDVTICSIRRKIRDAGTRALLVTKKRRGYQLVRPTDVHH